VISAVVVTPREDVPPVARAAAAEAIAGMPRLSTPEELADAALDAAWPLVPARVKRAVTELEVEVVRRLVVEHRMTRDEVAEALACTRDRVDVIMRRRITAGGGAGRHGQNRWKCTPESLAEVLAEARKAVGL
jgi:hypothetical protein